MAQRDQEIIDDQAILPQRRKRGRPRKYGYPNVSYEQRSSESNPTTSVLRLHATSPAHPARDLGHGMPSVPFAASSSMRPPSLPVKANPFSGLMHGKQIVQADADSIVNSSYGTQAALPPTYPSTYLSRRPRTTAPPTLAPTQACSTATSSHGPHSLLGQMVSGTLNGCFDSGYLLTVRVANTGHVLRGVVFDPHRCVPISGENDIAPLLPMITPSSAVDEPTQTLVSVPIHSVATSFPFPNPLQSREPAASSQTLSNLPPTSSLNTKGKKEDKAEIGCEVTPNDTDPTCGRNQVALEHTDARSKLAPNDTDSIVGIDEVAQKDTEVGPKTSPHDMEHVAGRDEVTLKDANVGSEVAPNDTDLIVGIHENAPMDTEDGPKTSPHDMEHMVGIDEVTLKDAEVGSKVAPNDSDVMVGIQLVPKDTEVVPKVAPEDTDPMVGRNGAIQDTQAGPTVGANDTDPMVDVNVAPEDAEVGPKPNDIDAMVGIEVATKDAEVGPKPNDSDAMVGIEVATKDAEVGPAVAANDTNPTVDINLTPTDTEARPKSSDIDANHESPSAASQAEIVTETRTMDSLDTSVAS